MRIPLNRIVTFFGPPISLIAGGASAWLVAKVNLLGLPGLDQANLATYLAASFTGTLTSTLTHLGQSKWLKGHHIELAAQAEAVAFGNAPADDEPVGPPEV